MKISKVSSRDFAVSILIVVENQPYQRHRRESIASSRYEKELQPAIDASAPLQIQQGLEGDGLEVDEEPSEYKDMVRFFHLLRRNLNSNAYITDIVGFDQEKRSDGKGIIP